MTATGGPGGAPGRAVPPVTAAGGRRVRLAAGVHVAHDGDGAPVVVDPAQQLRLRLDPADGDDAVELVDPAGRSHLVHPGSALETLERAVATGDMDARTALAARVHLVLTGDPVRREALDRLRARRAAVPHRSTPVAVIVAVLVVCRWWAPAVALGGLVAAAVAVAVDASTRDVVVAATLPLLLAVSTGVHEGGHLVALRRRLHDPAAGALLLLGRSVSVLRPPLAGRDRAVVAAAGPSAAAVTCLLGAAATSAWTLPSAALVLLAALHLANLAPWLPDGRSVLRSLAERRPDGAGSGS